MKLGFIGLAAPAAQLVRRMLQGSQAPLVWDADDAALAAFKQSGATAASSAHTVVERCDVIVLGLERDDPTRDLLFAADGLASSLRADQVVVDLSRAPPRAASQRSQRLALSGIAMLDAAVFVTAAETAPADMTIALAGPANVREKVAPAFEAITPNVSSAGTPVGNAQALRLLVSAITLCSGMASLEAIAAGRKMGLSLQSMIDVFVKGSARNYTTRFVLPALVTGRTALADPVPRLMQDLDDLIGLAIELAVPTPIAGAARGLLRVAAGSLGEKSAFEDVAHSVASMAHVRLVDTMNAAAVASAGADARPKAALKVGYVGVGAMGGALARRLLQTYPGLLVFDSRIETARALEADGATVAADLPSLARACDVVFICVPGSDIVRRVLFDAGGLAEGLAPGTIVVDQTTGDPVASAAIAAELQRRGIDAVDAPVSGGPETPRAGTSVMICGGPPDAFERVRPLLQAIGPNVHYCGPSGSGHAAKLVNNASNICNRATAYEAAMLACKLGVPLEVMHRVVNASTGWSWAGQRMFRAVQTHAQTADIRLELSLKDIASAVEMGVGCGAPMLLCDTVRSLWAGGVHQYGKDSNVDEIAHLFERMARIDFTTG